MDGTWELIAQGRTLVGVDTADTDFSTVKKTGGSKTVTLTTSQIPSHTHGLNSHTHSVGAHSHGLNSHTHSFSANTSNNGNHNHSTSGSWGALWKAAGGSGSTGWNCDAAANSSALKNQVMMTAITIKDSGAHTHSVSGTTGAASGSTANSTAFNTGAATSNTTSTGSGNSHTNLQPYYTCYIWCRTK